MDGQGANPAPGILRCPDFTPRKVPDQKLDSKYANNSDENIHRVP